MFSVNCSLVLSPKMFFLPGCDTRVFVVQLLDELALGAVDLMMGRLDVVDFAQVLAAVSAKMVEGL